MDDEPIVLRCKPPCGAPIVRALHEAGQPWVHQDDERVIKGGVLIVASRYNHPAEPDVIDVDAVKAAPEPPQQTIIAPWRFPPGR